VKSRGSTFDHGGIFSLNSLRNSSRSVYFCSGGRSCTRNGAGIFFFSTYRAASTFAAIMHSSISLWASLRWSMPAWVTSPSVPSTKRTSLDSNSIAPRLARARASTWYSWCRRCTCGNCDPITCKASSRCSGVASSPTAFQTWV
jgi:hypothetical protein